MSELGKKIERVVKHGGTCEEVATLIRQICQRYGSSESDVIGLQYFCLGEPKKTRAFLEKLLHRYLPAYQLGHIYGKLSTQPEQMACYNALLDFPKQYASFLVKRWTEDAAHHGRVLTVEEKTAVTVGYIEGIVGRALRPIQLSQIQSGLPVVN